MEILQTIWTALTTPNEQLYYIITIPFTFLEATVTMLFFTTILNITCNKSQKIAYVLVLSIASILLNFLLHEYSIIIKMILWPFIIMYIFKTTFLKSIVAEVIAFFSFIVAESLLLKIYLQIFNITPEIANTTPIYRIPFMLIMYLFVYMLYNLSKNLGFNITLLDNMDKKNKTLLIICFILGIVNIFIQNYINSYYSDTLPIAITLLSTLTLLSFFVIGLYSISKTTQLQLTTQNLEESQLYNKSLKILHDNVRAFKHDFSNIVQAIGGYIGTNDMDGLKTYYSQLLGDCDKVNNLYTLSPEVINNPAIYSLLTSKYHKADELGIKIHLEVFLNLNELNMKIYEFTRVLGILMDNAIEAACECEDKIINVEIRKDFKVKRQLLIVENTYTEKDVDLDKIYEKGYSSKPNNTGLGLWEVRQIMKKNNNLNLYTTKNDIFFNQQLEMYDN